MQRVALAVGLTLQAVAATAFVSPPFGWKYAPDRIAVTRALRRSALAPCRRATRGAADLSAQVLCACSFGAGSTRAVYARCESTSIRCQSSPPTLDCALACRSSLQMRWRS